MERPAEVTEFLRCGGVNCDNACASMCDRLGVEDCKTWRVHGYVQQLEKRIIHLEALNQSNLSVITMQERTRARLEERISQLESSIPRWISVEERLPENETPVLVSAKRKDWKGKVYNVVFTAFHTDGTTHTEDRGCEWEDCGLKYCEETDDYIIPEAWWEDVRYGEEVSKVYDTAVTHWMPLPQPPKEG